MQNHRWRWYKVKCVNALSGLYLISTWYQQRTRKDPFAMCQCPLGLIPHFYLTLKSFSCYFISVCQCPLGLIPHFYSELVLPKHHDQYGVNALSGLYLISTVPLQKPRFYAVSRACFCRYLSEYSDNNHFSCMLTIWTYLIATSTT